MGGYGGDSSQQRQTENCGNDWFWSSKADQERFVPRLTLTTEDPFKNRVWGFWIQPPRDLSGQLCGLSPLSHTWRLQSMVLNENDILWEFNTAFVRVVVLREQLIKNVLFIFFPPTPKSISDCRWQTSVSVLVWCNEHRPLFSIHAKEEKNKALQFLSDKSHQFWYLNHPPSFLSLSLVAYLGDIALDEEDMKSFKVVRIVDLAHRTVQTFNHTDSGTRFFYHCFSSMETNNSLT